MYLALLAGLIQSVQFTTTLYIKFSCHIVLQFQRACFVASTDFSDEGSTTEYNKPCCKHTCGNGEIRATFGTLVIKAKYCEIGDNYLTNFNEKSCGAVEGEKGGGKLLF